MLAISIPSSITRNPLIGCGTGYFSVFTDPTSCECEICPFGKYNDKQNAQSCTACPSGYTTSEVGSTSSSQCHIGKKISQSTIIMNLPLNFCCQMSKASSYKRR